jgi:hypothetical protein
MSSVLDTTHRDNPSGAADGPAMIEEIIETVHHCDCCGAPSITVPNIRCAHCDKELQIKAYVYERKGLFYGECLTLNLISRGSSQEEAIRRLQVAMFSYVQVVLSGAPPHGHLIPRSAPMESWLRYYSHVFMAWISRVVGRDYPLAIRSRPTSWNKEDRIVHC